MHVCEERNDPEGSPLIVLTVLLTSLSSSVVRGEDLSRLQGAWGGGRLGRGSKGAGGDWERGAGEGDSKDCATVITAREKALARESRGAAVVVEGRGDVGVHGEKAGGRAAWVPPEENWGGDLGRRELWGV